MHGTRMVRYAVIGAIALVLCLPAAVGASSPEPSGVGAFSCRARATKLGDEITLTFWLRTGQADRHWRIRIWDNDMLLLSRTRVTNQAGDIRVRAGAENLPHRDVFRFRATNRRGFSCRVDDLRV